MGKSPIKLNDPTWYASLRGVSGTVMDNIRNLRTDYKREKCTFFLKLLRYNRNIKSVRKFMCLSVRTISSTDALQLYAFRMNSRKTEGS